MILADYNTRHCAGRGCQRTEQCAKYQRFSVLPLRTLHWYGVAGGWCQHFEPNKEEIDRLEAMLKHSRKVMLQRKNKPLAKHASETLDVGTDERRCAVLAEMRKDMNE